MTPPWKQPEPDPWGKSGSHCWEWQPGEWKNERSWVKKEWRSDGWKGKSSHSSGHYVSNGWVDGQVGPAGRVRGEIGDATEPATACSRPSATETWSRNGSSILSISPPPLQQWGGWQASWKGGSDGVLRRRKDSK